MVALEMEILYWIQNLHTPWLDQLMVSISSLGNMGQFWIALALLFICIPKTRRIGISMLISILIGFLLGNLLLKDLFERPRPCWLDPSIALLVPSPTDFSFPSGHSLVSFEGAVSIWLQNKKLGIAALILAVFIALSRLYLFVHFPSDVVFGSLMGAGIAWLVYCIMQKRTCK
ncbi:MAG: phosphatase PAP2 family protein [Hungatella sp.]